MLKLTLPDADGFYADLVDHPNVLRVVALSGGYSRDDANARLARNPGVIASFSRALTEGLSAQQSDDEFDAALDATIDGIYTASITVTLQRGQPALRTTKPVRSFGVKNVDLGGISRPSRAVRVISATLTGRISTGSHCSPVRRRQRRSRSRPCW